MNNLLVTILMVMLGALVAFWGNLMAWLNGQSYREYLDKQIEQLEAAEQQPNASAPSWLNWCGLAFGAMSLLLARPGTSLYVVSLVVGVLGLLGNGIALTRKRRQKF